MMSDLSTAENGAQQNVFSVTFGNEFLRQHGDISGVISVPGSSLGDIQSLICIAHSRNL